MMDESREMRSEGLEIIAAFAFLGLLAKYGEARLVGSVALDLVVKPDIDFHLLVNHDQVVETAKSIVEALIADKRISEVRIVEYLDKNSLFIGIDSLPGRRANWSVDIWVTSDSSRTGFAEMEEYSSLLNEDNRQIILEIKRHYYQKGQLRGGLSPKIYRAVLKEGVTNLGNFQYDYRMGAGNQ